MSQTIRIVASPKDPNISTSSGVMPLALANHSERHGWTVEQLSVDGQVRVYPYGPQDNLIENGVAVMDWRSNERADAPPSRLWYWLGIPACIASIIAGAWLLDREAARRMEARQADRLIIDQHHTQDTP